MFELVNLIKIFKILHGFGPFAIDFDVFDHLIGIFNQNRMKLIEFYLKT